MTDECGSNYDVGKRVKEAQAAAKAIGTTLLAHNAAIRQALFRCLQLVEDWKSDLYREKLTAYFREDYPQRAKKKGGGDDDVAAVLVVVQCVFADEDKTQHNWHANALRQAMADGRTSENVVDYFEKVASPTDAAKKWPKTKKALAKALVEPPPSPPRGTKASSGNNDNPTPVVVEGVPSEPKPVTEPASDGAAADEPPIDPASIDLVGRARFYQYDKAGQVYSWPVTVQNLAQFMDATTLSQVMVLALGNGVDPNSGNEADAGSA
jgi:hypothetical protein